MKPLVVEVESSTESTSPVDTVLQQLISHFNQEIHQIIDDVDVVVHNERGPIIEPIDEDNEGDLETDSANLPKILQYWLDEVLPTNPSLNDVLSYIEGYETNVRPVLLEYLSKPSHAPFVGFVPVALHYEMVLAEWLQRQKEEEFKSRINSLTTTKQQTQMNGLYKSMELLSTDLTLLTSERYFPKLSLAARHCGLATLLRLLDYNVHLQSLLENRQSTENNDVVTSLHPHNNNVRREDALRRCIVTLLAFSDGKCKIDPTDVTPSMLLDSTKHNIDKQLAFPPRNEFSTLPLSDQDVQAWNEALNLEGVGWNDVAFSTVLWSKNNDITAAVKGIWAKLRGEWGLKSRENEEGDHLDLISGHISILEQTGGLVPFYKAIRAHFFGRDMVDWQPKMHTSQQVVLGRRVTKTEPVVSDPQHRVIPSRMAAALSSLRFLTRIPDEESSKATFWNDIMGEVFPVLATLTDSNHNFEISLGASGLLCLLEAFLKSNIKLGQLGETGKNFLDNTLSVLDLGFKISEGAATVAIGQAQCCAFRIMEQEHGLTLPLDYRNRRQKITQKWFADLMRYNRPDEDSRRWGLLVGGVVPLLYQMARDTSSADGMEIVRHALSVLLPLIDQNEILVDEKTEMVALMALINLLLAAHPIMPDHGGKILSALLSAATLAPQKHPTHKLAIHAGAVALVICGPKFTDDIMSRVQNETNRFQDRLKASATSMAALAAKMTTQSRKKEEKWNK